MQKPERKLVEGFVLEHWFEEGLGKYSLDGDALLVDAVEGGYTAFYKNELPDNILVQYTCRILPPQGQNNINLISHCRPPVPGKWPIVEAGRYKGYHAMPNYTVTFVGGYNEFENIRECDGRQRLRRNPGFELIEEKDVYPSDLGRDYRITFACRAGHIQYFIDDTKIFDWQDPRPITGGGFFALRTYKTKAVYSNFRILRLPEAAE